MSPVLRLVPAALLALSVSACAPSGDPMEGGAGAEPALSVQSPARGSVSGDLEVLVSGTVSGAPGAKVTVGDREAEIGPDGAFELMVPLEPGINLIETTLRGDGSEQSDVRAVLAGELVPGSGAARDAVVLHFTPQTLELLGQRAGQFARGALDKLIAGDEPAFQIGSDCFGADFYLDELTTDEMTFDPRLVDGGIDFDVTIRGLAAHFSADYKLFCTGATTDVDLSADLVEASGVMELGKNPAGGLLAEMTGLSTQVQNMNLDVGLLPDDFDASLEEGIQSYLSEFATGVVPKLVNSVLGGLKTSATLSVGDNELEVDVVPSEVSFTPSGGVIKADTAVELGGGVGPRYVATERAAPDAAGDRYPLGLAIADDAFDQLFGAVWSAGVLDVEGDATDSLALFQTVGADHVALHFPLPPTVASADGGGPPVVTVGDLELTLSRGGAQVARIAVSMRSSIDVTIDGDRLKLKTGSPEIFANLIESDGTFGDHELEVVRSFFETLLKSDLGAALEGLPLSDGLGELLGHPAISTAGGYIFLGDASP